MKEKTKNGAKNKELEKKLLVGLGFNLGFVSKFSFFQVFTKNKRGEGENEKWGKKQRIGKEVTGGVRVQFRFCIQVFIFPVSRASSLTPGGKGQVNRKCFLSYWPFLH